MEIRGPPNRLRQLARLDRLREILRGAIIERFDRGFDAGKTSHEDDGQVQAVLTNRAQKRDAAHGWHRDITEDHVERIHRQELESFGRARGSLDQ